MEEKLNITIESILEDSDLLELFLEVIYHQMETDGEKPESKARHLIVAFLEGDCDDLLVSLTGWGMETLLKITALKSLWDEFSDTPIDDDECIDTDFYDWPKGTDRYEIWHWFDENCPNNLHDDLMFSE